MLIQSVLIIKSSIHHVVIWTNTRKGKWKRRRHPVLRDKVRMLQLCETYSFCTHSHCVSITLLSWNAMKPCMEEALKLERISFSSQDITNCSSDGWSQGPAGTGGIVWIEKKCYSSLTGQKLSLWHGPYIYISFAPQIKLQFCYAECSYKVC